MRIKEIALELIDIPPVRVTAVYDEELTKLLRDNMDAMGQKTPIVVVAHDTRYDLVDGLHRLGEARRRGDKTIPAVTYQGTREDSLVLNLVLNKMRGKTRASEMVAVIGSLWKEHGLDSDALAQKTGLTRDYIERLQMISTAAPSVQEALDREVIGVGVAYELSRLPRREQQDEVVAKLQIWRMAVKDVKELVDQTLAYMEQIPANAQPGQPKEPPPPPRYECEACHKDIPPKYLRPIVVCPDCFGRLWRQIETERKGEAKVSEVTSPP